MAGVNRRHGFYVLVMIIGWVLPPIAVLLRFGFGTDFFLNCLLTIAGYIPGHGHNFYLQNIRNNSNRKRTPAWATKAGLIKDPSAKRKQKTQWANRYDERTPTRADGYQDEEVVRPDSLSSSSTTTGPLEARDLEVSSSSRDRPRPHRQQSHESFYSTGHGSTIGGTGNGSPKLRKSLSAKFMRGLGKKPEKKDRFSRSKEARDEWNNTIAGSIYDHDQHSNRRVQAVGGDGLDHTF
ncbi:hypothetical protein CROQUDRAFT_651949 [Cronartium quercuum f. sp. fusiforme G11]|uniref:Uncharacterized protein n=1 Tax=Cronartium quercuum f. sp. fusiforme G11 TaxID=708437 RepID=A0A9P6TFJ6_9BASI|nr:hypothetical protein CROQUDRAFT_651949 [Cronartium quercuum f. sp. fusiforme G11]